MSSTADIQAKHNRDCKAVRYLVLDRRPFVGFKFLTFTCTAPATFV